MTLKNDLDFQLEKFHKDALVEEALKVYYGADGTGDILNQANIDAFAAMVEQDTEGQGVSLVSADGVSSFCVDFNVVRAAIKIVGYLLILSLQCFL